MVVFLENVISNLIVRFFLEKYILEKLQSFIKKEYFFGKKTMSSL